MVLLSGCRLTETGSDCHYISGNVWAEKRARRIEAMLERIGIDKRRFRLEWVSAAEGDKWADIIRAMTKQLKEMGHEHIVTENKRVRPALEEQIAKLAPKAAPAAQVRASKGVDE